MTLEVQRVLRVAKRLCQIPLLAAAMSLLLVGCFGGGNNNEEAAAEQPAVAPIVLPQTTLVCSEMCSQNGQCGQGVDGRVYVLARSDQPNTQNHDRIFPVDTAVEILQSEQRNIQRPGSEPVPQPFTLINLVNEQKTGWVVDWCIVK